MRFFDGDAELDKSRRDLPHWRQPETLSYVTFRLEDSLPQPLLRRWKQDEAGWIQAHPPPWDVKIEEEYHRRFSDRFHEYLDADYGSCILRLPAAKDFVSSAIRHFDRQRYDLDEWCVAANHVHVLVAPRDGADLSSITHTWKSFTGHRLLELPEVRQRLRRRKVWQKESFDHLVRSERSLERIREYIRRHK